MAITTVLLTVGPVDPDHNRQGAEIASGAERKIIVKSPRLPP